MDNGGWVGQSDKCVSVDVLCNRREVPDLWG